MYKYTEEVTTLNPMETAPYWDYYNGNVDVVELFFQLDEYPRPIVSVLAYFNTSSKTWHLYYNNSVIYEEPLGWLPRREYVSIN